MAKLVSNETFLAARAVLVNAATAQQTLDEGVTSTISSGKDSR